MLEQVVSGHLPIGGQRPPIPARAEGTVLREFIMFTGLVEKTGKLIRLEEREGGVRLVLDATWDDLEHGESICVSGACLSLASEEGGLAFDVLQETLDKTSLGAKRPGDLLNLERSLKFGDRMGGHVVTGHVDTTGTVAATDAVGSDWKLRIACDKETLAGMVYKGSICIDGISLTVADLDDDGFTVHLIPITWEVTSIHQLKVGDAVNLEVDILAKLVRRRLETGEPIGDLTWESFRLEP